MVVVPVLTRANPSSYLLMRLAKYIVSDDETVLNLLMRLAPLEKKNLLMLREKANFVVAIIVASAPRKRIGKPAHRLDGAPFGAR